MNQTFRFNGALPLVVIALFAILLILLIPLLILGLAGAAFARLGFSFLEAITVIVLMIIGYFINIPLWTVPDSVIPAKSNEETVFDAFTGEPADTGNSSIRITLNLGGAVIPAAISGYLLYQIRGVGAGQIYLPLVVCFVAVTLIVVLSTKFLSPWRIGAPLIFPSLAATGCGFLLNGGIGLEAAVTAFVGGTTGIVLGATASSLWQEKNLGLRQISIGGTGMFGPVLLCALLSALIA